MKLTWRQNLIEDRMSRVDGMVLIAVDGQEYPDQAIHPELWNEE